MLPPLHDDYLPPDPRIPPNRGARKAQDRICLPNLTELAPARSADTPGRGQAGGWPTRPYVRWPWFDRASDAQPVRYEQRQRLVMLITSARTRRQLFQERNYASPWS